jgi:hypothetical protein
MPVTPVQKKQTKPLHFANSVLLKLTCTNAQIEHTTHSFLKPDD